MAEDDITQLVVKGYGCVQDATLKLTPLHALIGPNDSGKSTLLKAMRVALDLAYRVSPAGAWRPSPAPFSIKLQRAKGQFAIAVDASERTIAAHLFFGEAAIAHLGNEAQWVERAIQAGGADPATKAAGLAALARGARFVRLNTAALRAPSGLIPNQNPILLDEVGTGLAGVLDAVQTRNVDAFLALREDVRKLFPAVRNLSVPNVSNAQKVVAIDLADGTRIQPEYLSDGILYYIAFRALAYLEPVSAILIEEPENGLHPARIKEVMNVLREISKTTQVVLATHSPFVVNELEGDEISVVTRTAEKGTQVTLLKDTPNFDERRKVYALGELWVSYANGEHEEPLFAKPVKPEDPGPEVAWPEPERSTG